VHNSPTASPVCDLYFLLGLLGWPCSQRNTGTKEFGIRRYWGPGQHVVHLLSKDFLVLVLIAFVFASPLAWWAMQMAGSEFAYHVDLEWWVFLLAGLGAADRTADGECAGDQGSYCNPVKSLRTE